MDDFGSLHADTHVWPLGVVEPDNPFQYASAFIPCRYRHLVKPFDLQYSVRSFGDGVFQRVAALVMLMLIPRRFSSATYSLLQY